MSMKAQIHTDSRGNITVHMYGDLNYETGLPLRSELSELAVDNPNSTITLDMNCVDFVGSSGIGIFVETLRILNDKKDQIRLSNVKSEFIKVFKLYNFDAIEALIHDIDNTNTKALNQKFGNRKRTFEN